MTSCASGLAGVCCPAYCPGFSAMRLESGGFQPVLTPIVSREAGEGRPEFSAAAARRCPRSPVIGGESVGVSLFTPNCTVRPFRRHTLGINSMCSMNAAGRRLLSKPREVATGHVYVRGHLGGKSGESQPKIL